MYAIWFDINYTKKQNDIHFVILKQNDFSYRFPFQICDVILFLLFSNAKYFDTHLVSRNSDDHFLHGNLSQECTRMTTTDTPKNHNLEMKIRSFNSNTGHHFHLFNFLVNSRKSLSETILKPPQWDKLNIFHDQTFFSWNIEDFQLFYKSLNT